MQGVAVGRAVDLTRLDGYDDLRRKLEEMFDIPGELSASLKKWKVIYTDDEDDMMLVGDDPWRYVPLRSIRLVMGTFRSPWLCRGGYLTRGFFLSSVAVNFAGW